MDLKISDLTGLSKPLEKLITEVSKGIGTLYRPRAIRNEGAAEAARVKAVELAKAEASEESKAIALSGTLGRLSALVNDDPELLRRARVRLVQREIEGQLNIEQIADAAVRYLPEGEPSAEPLADDWRRKFFKQAEDVSDSTLQDMWARILAGEVTQPSTFSVRTLDVLAGLSTSEATVFSRFLRVCLTSNLLGSPQWDPDRLPGLTFDELMILEQCGLIHAATPVRMSWRTVEINTVQSFGFPNGGSMVVLVPAGKALSPIPYIALARPGVDLQKVTPVLPDLAHVVATAERFRSQDMRVFFGGPDAARLNQLAADSSAPTGG